MPRTKGETHALARQRGHRRQQADLAERLDEIAERLARLGGGDRVSEAEEAHRVRRGVGLALQVPGADGAARSRRQVVTRARDGIDGGER